MTFETGIVFAIVSLAVILFFTEKFTVDTVATGVMVLFMLLGILEIEEVMAGFANSATITVAAMFVVSQAIFNTELDWKKQVGQNYSGAKYLRYLVYLVHRLC